MSQGSVLAPFAAVFAEPAGSPIRELFPYLSRPGMISLAGGYPSPSLFDAEGLALHLVDMEEMVHVAKIEQLQGRASEWFDVAELTPAPGGALLPPMMTIQLIGGRKEKIRAGDVMGAMCADFGYTREQIGKISVNDFSTYVAVDRRIAAEACAKLNAGRVKGKSVRARVL